VLTFQSATVALASRPAGRRAATAALAVLISAAIWNTAHADGVVLGGCLGGGGSVNCVVRWGEAGDPYVRQVPAPIDEVEKQHAAERDKRWEQRCRPTIAQDRYGVPRYQYAAPGCEFGVLQ
jgi:hypothetical protein